VTTPNEPILVGAALTGIGLFTVWFVAQFMAVRDLVRDVHTHIVDPHTGLRPGLARLEGRVDAVEDAVRDLGHGA
jgi:hypothetical protein